MQQRFDLHPSLRAGLTVLHVLIAALYIGLAVSYQLINNDIPKSAYDFLAFYSAGQIAAQQKNPYDTDKLSENERVIIKQYHALTPENVPAFINPPPAAFLFIPFSVLSYLEAFYVWLGINLLLSAAIAWEICRMFRAYPKQDRWFVAAISFGWFPWGIALLQGQVSVLLCLALLRFINEMQTRPLKAAVWSGAFILKPHLFLLMLIPLAMFGYKKLIAWCGAVAIVLMALSSFYFDPNIWTAYLELLQRIQAEGVLYNASVSAMMNVRGIVALLTDGYTISLISLIMIYALGGVVIGIAAYRLRESTLIIQQLLIAASVVCAALLGPWLHAHDIFLLLPALLILLSVLPVSVKKLWVPLYGVVLLATLLPELQQSMSILLQLMLLGAMVVIMRNTQEARL